MIRERTFAWSATAVRKVGDAKGRLGATAGAARRVSDLPHD